jgi:hypothetical protein
MASRKNQFDSESAFKTMLKSVNPCYSCLKAEPSLKTSGKINSAVITNRLGVNHFARGSFI